MRTPWLHSQRVLLSCSNISELVSRVLARRKRERKEEAIKGPSWRGMGVECGGSGLGNNSSLLIAGNTLEGQRVLPFWTAKNGKEG